MVIEELIAKYVDGGSLASAELKFLRSELSRGVLESLASGPAGGHGVSRRLHKLCNVLFSVKKGQSKTQLAAPQPPSMFQELKNLKPDQNVKVVSGGGANGTGKRS